MNPLMISRIGVAVESDRIMSNRRQLALSRTQKEHYKMYKKGRFWLFAGVLVMTTWQGNQVISRAAETVTTDTAEKASAVSTGVTQLTSKTVTLGSNATSSAVSESGSLTSDGSKTNTSATSASVVGTSESSMSVATRSSMSAKKSQTSQSASSTSVTSAISSTAKKNTSVVKSSAAIPVSQENDSLISEPIKVDDKDNTPVRSDQLITDDLTAVATVDNANIGDLMTAENISSQLKVTDAVVPQTGPKEQKVINRRMLMRASAADIDAGDGWNIDSNGVLHILSGVDLSSSVALNTRWLNNASSITSIAFDGPVTAGISTENLFKGLNKVTTITGLDNLDTSKTTNVSAMFSGMTSLTALDLSNWNIGNATNIDDMFLNDTALKSLNVSGWQLNSSIKDLGSLFANLTDLTDMTANNFDASSLSYSVGNLFDGDTQLTTLKAANWDLSNISVLTGMFMKLPALTTILAPGWKTGEVVNLSQLFMNDPNLTTADLSGWQTASVTDTSNMFYRDSKLTTLNLNNWDTSSLADASGMFYQDSSLVNLDVSKWNTGNLQLANQMFAQMSNLAGLDVSKWNTSSLIDATSMFDLDKSLTTLDVSNWDTSNVTSMSQMLSRIPAVSELDVSKFQTGSLVNASGMFYGDTGLVTLDVSNWDTSNLSNAQTMFALMTNVPSIDVSRWNTSSLTDGTDMFYRDFGLKSLDISNWDVSNLVSAHAMFNNMPNLAALDVSKWRPVNLQDASYMFSMDSEVTEFDLSKWGAIQITTTAHMFDQDSKLESLDLSGIGMSNVADAYMMLISVTALKKLTLGAENKFDFAEAGAQLPEIQVTPDYHGYTGYWVDTKGNMFTSKQLMAQFDGATMADTYVWQIRQTTLHVHDSTVNQTGTNQWQLADNFTDGTDIYGNALTSADVEIVDGKVDTTTPGTYKVTYRYTDAANYKIPVIATITVIASKVAVMAHDTTVTQGQDWQGKDSFGQALDFDGNAVDLKDVTVTGANKVNTKVLGDYQVTYSYTDANGNAASKTITVTVAKSAVAVDASDTTITQGQAWTAADSFKGAMDAAGNTVDWKDVTVTGADAVNTKVPGDYQVAYSYTDAYGNSVEKTITVTVTKSAVAVDASDATITQGQAWTPVASFKGATDAAGNGVDFKNVTVTGADIVNVKDPGNYQVSYSYTDAYGNTAEKTITVTVDASQLGLDVKDVTVQQGSQWQAADNFVNATDENGQSVDFAAVTVIGDDAVDTSTPGSYPVTYSYEDGLGNTITKTVTVTVTATPDTDNGTAGGNTNGSNGNGQADTITTTDPKGFQNGTKVVPTVATTKTEMHALAPKSATNKANTLPQTDEQATRGAILLGITLLGMTSVLGFFGKKRHTEK